MNQRAVAAIIRRDLKIVRQSKAVMMPLIIVPILLLVIMPAVVALLIPSALNLVGSTVAGLQSFLENMPDGLREELAGHSEPQQMVLAVLLYFFAPMYLILPYMVANVIAADSFAGEKERKTLEALLYTPTTDQELFLAKLLSAWLPALAVAWGGFVLYGLIANLAAWPVMERIFFPNTMWIALALWVVPPMAGLGLIMSLIVSSRVQTFQEAYQLGSIAVLLIVLLIIGQATGLMYLSFELVLLFGLILWIIDAVLFWIGSRLFRRGQILAHS